MRINEANLNMNMKLPLCHFIFPAVPGIAGKPGHLFTHPRELSGTPTRALPLATSDDASSSSPTASTNVTTLSTYVM